MKQKIVFLIIVAFLVLALIPSRGVKAQTPDDIRLWQITIQPNPDGTLHMRYDLDYCARTTFPSAELYFPAPVYTFTLNDAGSSIGSGNAQDGYNMYVYFDHVPETNECFTVFYDFTVTDFAVRSGEDVQYEYISPEVAFATVERMTVSWQLPPDPNLVKYTDPSPVIDGGIARWEFANLQPSQLATVQIVFAASAFPQLSEEQPWVPSESQQPSGSSPKSGGSNTNALKVFFIIIGVVIVLVVIVVLISFLADRVSTTDTVYTPTRGYGTYHSTSHDDDDDGGRVVTGRSSPSHSPPSRPTYSPPSSSPSGSGSYSGRGSSCVSSCVHSCVCACACASAGRAGCSAKGIGFTKATLERLLGEE